MSEETDTQTQKFINESEVLGEGKVEFISCFYCDDTKQKRFMEKDHFPVPKSEKGVNTVYACESCHEFKDRITLSNFPSGWYENIKEQFLSAPKELRIFIAKCFRLTQQKIEGSGE